MAKKVVITDKPHSEGVDLMLTVLRPLAAQLCADNQTRWRYEASFVSDQGERCTATLTLERQA